MSVPAWRMCGINSRAGLPALGCMLVRWCYHHRRGGWSMQRSATESRLLKDSRLPVGPCHLLSRVPLQPGPDLGLDGSPSASNPPKKVLTKEDVSERDVHPLQRCRRSPFKVLLQSRGVHVMINPTAVATAIAQCLIVLWWPWDEPEGAGHPDLMVLSEFYHKSALDTNH